MTDLEFVSYCSSGNHKAWQKFIDRYARLIYAYILSVLRYKGAEHIKEEAIRDIFQEIILSLVKDHFRKLKTFSGKNGCSLASWLRQVTINFTLDYLRKPQFFSLSFEERDETAYRQPLREEFFSMTHLVIDKERIEHLKDCIRRLRVDEKYFMEMHIYRNVCLDKLRKHLKLSRGAIYMQKSRIIAKIRECFKNKGFVFNF